MLKTVVQGVAAVLLGFAVVVAVALVVQSLRKPGPFVPDRVARETPAARTQAPPITDLQLRPLPMPSKPSSPPGQMEERGGFPLPDRGASYLAILVDLLETERTTHPERVRQALEALQRLDAPDPRIYRWLGTLYHQEKAYQQAVVAFERAVDLDPDNATDRFNLATVYLLQERFPQAIRELNHVIRLQPPFLDDAYAYLGYCLHAMGDDQQARKAWEISLQIDPNNPVARRYSTLP